MELQELDEDAPLLQTQVSMEPMDVIHGYEHATFEPLVVTPKHPYSKGPPDERDVKPKTMTNFAMDESDVRSHLERFVSDKRCFGKAAAKHCTIDSIEATRGYQYTLRTYAEKREICWDFAPYHSEGDIKGPADGVAPDVWDVEFEHGIPNFQDGSAHCPVPYTASVKSCRFCAGEGGVACNQHGCEFGRITCHDCHGHFKSERPESEECHESHLHCPSCSCYGWVLCPQCHGTAKSKCLKCDGSGKLKFYIKLTISMENHKSYDFIDKSHGWQTHDLPEAVAMQGHGDLMFEEQGARVWPIQDFRVQNKLQSDIADVSTHNITKHEREFGDELIHAQYQTVTIIPLTRVICTYKGEQKKFYIYGKEKDIYFPDYYSQCSCCAIL